MKYALFIVVPSTKDTSNVSEFVSSFQNSEERPENNKRLALGVWELDLKDGLQDLANMIAHAKAHRLQSQVLFSEAEFPDLPGRVQVDENLEEAVDHFFPPDQIGVPRCFLAEPRGTGGVWMEHSRCLT